MRPDIGPAYTSVLRPFFYFYDNMRTIENNDGGNKKNLKTNYKLIIFYNFPCVLRVL